MKLRELTTKNEKTEFMYIHYLAGLSNRLDFKKSTIPVNLLAKIICGSRKIKK